MPRPSFPKTLRQFQSDFATEEACRRYLAACRWPDGFICPRCGHRRAYELVNQSRRQCASCRHQVSLTAGTVLHRTKIPNIDAAAGSLQEIQRIMERIRGRWPEVRVILRGDSGFCRDELMHWCEQQQNVYFVFGMARNQRLRRIIAPQLTEAAVAYQRTQRPARVFADFVHQTTSGSWARQRRVVAKAEHIDGKENPRYIVTSLEADAWPAQKLYEELYCARGDMENRIKEQFQLFAGRLSTETMRSNQLRLYCRPWPMCWSADCAAWA